ncbi:hypothetical protein NST77_00285 [Niallia sp. FSL W8-0177]
MNTTIQKDRGKRGVHEENESHNPGRLSKRGVHQGNEHHNPGRPREKRCS